jgi:uncharacterized protein (TIGR03083 family)
MDLDDLTAAQTAVTELLAGLAPVDWEKPTPCEEWDVAGVIRHLATGERAFTTSLGGEAYDLAAIRDELARARSRRASDRCPHPRSPSCAPSSA